MGVLGKTFKLEEESAALLLHLPLLFAETAVFGSASVFCCCLVVAAAQQRGGTKVTIQLGIDWIQIAMVALLGVIAALLTTIVGLSLKGEKSRSLYRRFCGYKNS